MSALKMLRLHALENFLYLEEIIPERGIAQGFGKRLPDCMACGFPHPDIGNARGVKRCVEIAQRQRASNGVRNVVMLR